MLRLFISGVEFRMTNQYQIKEQVGQTATATVTALQEDNPLPVTQQRAEVREADGVTKIYTGIIQTIDPPAWSSGFETYLLTMSLKTLEIVFDRRIVNEAIEALNTSEIVDYLFDEYLLEESLTKGTIGTFTRYYEKYVSSGLKLRKVLDELGDAVGAAARVSPAGVFSFWRGCISF